MTAETPILVLDASVGVKWFRDEHGSREARELLGAHGRGEVRLVVPSLFVYELMSVAERVLSAAEADQLWRFFIAWRVNVVGVGDSLMRESLNVRRELACSLYDAVAPALARELRAELVSADRRAHGGWEDVRLLG